ncbi:LysR family transcriptional regulator [Streptomyces sp. NPDC101225]|uniref:LysR family transcriptional regulator n=1 Tax=Streptomyces sp. NPDC101225 TaxID=3366135 RepID=UPI0038206FB7
MDLRWMRVLVELAEHGTLRAAADVTGYSTSAVSQQLAVLQRSLGVVLVEPVGRTLALTPAGRAFLPRTRAPSSPRSTRPAVTSRPRARSRAGPDSPGTPPALPAMWSPPSPRCATGTPA